jgi:UDP-N-acetylmuramoyl-tripeptide--D-alanyl-D-alanine ligase
MTQLLLSFIQNALKNRVSHCHGNIDTHFEGVSINSRTIKPGEIFFALKGERLDGHQFVEQVFQRGGTLAVVNRDYQPFSSRTFHAFIFVDDTLKALHDLSRNYLQSLPARRIALTGSSGKTTTKELIRHVLSAVLGEETVYASSGNQNNHFGVPLSIFSINPKHQIAILEMGMNHFGEITTLAQIIKPSIGLIVNMGTAHAGNLGGPDGVAKAKAELYEALTVSDIAIVNADDPRCLREATAKVKGKQIRFGKAPWADIRIESTEPTWGKSNGQQSRSLGMHITLVFQNKKETAWLPLLGVHNAQNAAAAVAVAMALNLDFKTAVHGLSSMQAVHGRLEAHALSNGALLIDDTYNANPESMEAGLSVLSAWENRRRVAILGEMAELGENAYAIHRTIGAACVQKNVDLLLACGPNAKAYGEGAIATGLPKECFFWAQSSAEIALIATSQIKNNDVILVKGSRFTEMEKVVIKLLSL